MAHIPVLLQETIIGLNSKPGDIILDGTVGNGGHSKALCEYGKESIRIIAVDADQVSLNRAKQNLADIKCPVTYINRNFRDIDDVLKELEVENVNGILLDLGWSSDQFKESGKGFSFQTDEPLFMTYGDPKKASFTARDIVNTWKPEQIETILKAYGDERYARLIVRKIVEVREKKPIETTFELVEIIRKATPARYHHLKIHLATKTFQALRIAVNDEIESLQVALRKGLECLAENGRMAIISFHSTEDRIVKRAFLEFKKQNRGTIITKRPIQASREEISINPRARSAKLRIIEKI